MLNRINFFPLAPIFCLVGLAFANYEHALLGRIWVLRDSTMRMELLSASAQAIHCHTFSLFHKKYFLLSMIYGSNPSADRRDL